MAEEREREEMLLDLQHLARLYGLLQNTEDGKRESDEKSRLLLKKLLDGARGRVLQSQTRMFTKEHSLISSNSKLSGQRMYPKDIELGHKGKPCSCCKGKEVQRVAMDQQRSESEEKRENGIRGRDVVQLQKKLKTTCSYSKEDAGDCIRKRVLNPEKKASLEKPWMPENVNLGFYNQSRPRSHLRQHRHRRHTEAEEQCGSNANSWERMATEFHRNTSISSARISSLRVRNDGKQSVAPFRLSSGSRTSPLIRELNLKRRRSRRTETDFDETRSRLEKDIEGLPTACCGRARDDCRAKAQIQKPDAVALLCCSNNDEEKSRTNSAILMPSREKELRKSVMKSPITPSAGQPPLTSKRSLHHCMNEIMRSRNLSKLVATETEKNAESSRPRSRLAKALGELEENREKACFRGEHIPYMYRRAIKPSQIPYGVGRKNPASRGDAASRVRAPENAKPGLDIQLENTRALQEIDPKSVIAPSYRKAGNNPSHGSRSKHRIQYRDEKYREICLQGRKNLKQKPPQHLHRTRRRNGVKDYPLNSNWSSKNSRQWSSYTEALTGTSTESLSRESCCSTEPSLSRQTTSTSPTCSSCSPTTATSSSVRPRAANQLVLPKRYVGPVSLAKLPATRRETRARRRSGRGSAGEKGYSRSSSQTGPPREGRLRRLKNKLAIIFHHHHHHHHHHHRRRDGRDDEDELDSEVASEKHRSHRSFWRYFRRILRRRRDDAHEEYYGDRAAERLANPARRREHGYLYAMVEALLRHVWRRSRKRGKTGGKRLGNVSRAKGKNIGCWRNLRKHGGVKLAKRKKPRLAMGSRRWQKTTT